MKRKIEPTILRTVRDFLPPQVVRRSAVTRAVRGAFDQFGRTPLQASVLSAAEIYPGREAIGMDRPAGYVRQNETALRSIQHHGHMLPVSAD